MIAGLNAEARKQVASGTFLKGGLRNTGEDAGVSKKKIIDEAGGPHPQVDAFVGKASPETFERVLALVYQYREALVSAYGKSHTEPYKTCVRPHRRDH